MQDTRIAIVGAGIGGLTAAAALQQHGFKVDVCEQAEQLAEVGAGLTLSPNATHALEAVGIGPGLAAKGMRPRRQGVMHFRTGEILVDQERGDLPKQKYGAHYYQIHRADLHDLLAEQVRARDPAAIKLGHAFAGLTQDDAGVTLRFADGRAVRADIVVGCDGIKSEVRTQVWGAEAPQFTGIVAWRGLVPVARLPADFVVYPHSGVGIGKAHMFTRYLIRGGAVVNYVAFAETSGWEKEGWSVRSDVSEVLNEFAGWHEKFTTVMAATPPELCHKWALHDRPPLRQWCRGRVTLLGDAAHPMLPFLGMGAAMAIEDGVVLARAFAAAATPEEGLARYEAARRERCTFVQIASRSAQDRLLGGHADTYTEKSHKNEEVLGLFDYNPATVPV